MATTVEVSSKLVGDAQPAQGAADTEAGDSDSEQHWNEECNELLGEVLETQSEIASLLKNHDADTQSLTQMKQQCDDELVELQEDAWKLKVYMELQRMGQQLERLASGPGDSKDAEADCAGKERDTAAADEHGVSTGSGVPSCKQHEAGLQELDDEIADLDRQLVAARAELQGLMQAAQSVEGELEALSVADD